MSFGASLYFLYFLDRIQLTDHCELTTRSNLLLNHCKFKMSSFLGTDVVPITNNELGE